MRPPSTAKATPASYVSGSGNGVSYLLRDHLGSSSVIADSVGALNGRNYYYPYGDNRGGAQSALTTKRFTGQYHEAGIGLYDYNARWYDPVLGRFVSADTIVPDPGSSQSLNRYMYTLGNPLRFSDPSGHCPTTISNLADQSAVVEFQNCWERAGQLLGMYDSDPWFAERFKISRDAWVTDIAMNPSTDSAWMQQQLDSWWSDFTLRTGLQHPDRSVEWHEPPPHPMTVANNFCRENDCVGHTLNTVGTGVALVVLGICIANAPACGTAATIGSGVGIATSGTGVVNTAVRVKNNDADEIDLLASTGTFVVGASGPFARHFNRIITPAISAAASLFQTIWDNRSNVQGANYE